MEEGFNLHTLIIKSVEKQIDENDPPVTGDTYRRLLDNGHDEETAKEMIAAAIAEEIYHMMHEDRPLSLELYSERLAELE